ncbi:MULTISPECIES: hypothetical protein [unclassified Leptolyngbya]|nr:MULTISPECIES: hypothetical protein [unclassified Leptolyngbya]MBD1911765.1 hypothetical protein [Leptolyngbya sp. FACHB-8]MBD2153345.1 hypothetical protein [Leptolyngbya sp. FACHB-16]
MALLKRAHPSFSEPQSFERVAIAPPNTCSIWLNFGAPQYELQAGF